MYPSLRVAASLLQMVHQIDPERKVAPNIGLGIKTHLVKVTEGKGKIVTQARGMAHGIMIHVLHIDSAREVQQGIETMTETGIETDAEMIGTARDARMDLRGPNVAKDTIVNEMTGGEIIGADIILNLNIVTPSCSHTFNSGTTHIPCF